MVPDGDVERVYMISGIDDHGDIELFMTDERQRADARYRMMQGRLKDVRRNEAWDDLGDIPQ